MLQPFVVGRTGICTGCKETKPRAPGHYILVCAHVNVHGDACRDLDVNGKWLILPSAAERKRNLEILLREIETWPGEPATYDLEPPPAS